MSLKIVILGATGFVGRALVKRLQQDGNDVTVLSRNLNAHLLRLLPPTVKHINADVYDLAKLQHAIQGADAVISTIGATQLFGEPLLRHDERRELRQYRIAT